MVRARWLGWAAAAVMCGGLAGCASSGGAPASGPATTSPAPAASVNPSSNGLITGPINQARSTANSLDRQQAGEQSQTGG